MSPHANQPLTPTEHAEVNAALENVKAEFDGERLQKVDKLDYLKYYSQTMLDACNKEPLLFSDNTRNTYLELIPGYHLAAELLASQMAGRLAGVTQ